MTAKFYFLLALFLIPNITQAMHPGTIYSDVSDSPASSPESVAISPKTVAPESVAVSPTIAPKSVAVGPKTVDDEKYLKDLRATRQFVFNTLADKKGLTEKARDAFIAEKWKLAALIDASLAKRYGTPKN